MRKSLLMKVGGGTVFEKRCNARAQPTRRPEAFVPVSLGSLRVVVGLEPQRCFDGRQIPQMGASHIIQASSAPLSCLASAR